MAFGDLMSRCGLGWCWRGVEVEEVEDSRAGGWGLRNGWRSGT